jgi:peptidoglycan/LPS O-acetylase OafA/YrhL
MKAPRFEALDGWRGIAALSVAMQHLSVASHFYTIAWVHQAGMFVDLFFVLSGFVISHSYFNKLSAGGMFGDFAIRRFGRLWPLHISMLALFVGLELIKLLLLRVGHLTAGEGAFTNERSPYALVTNVFMLHSLGLHDFYTWNGPSWSISVEFWTYIVFALVARYASRFVVLISIVLGLISATILYSYDSDGGAWFKWGIFRCVMCFFLGVVVYRLYREKPAFMSNAAWEWAALGASVALASAGEMINILFIKPIVFGFLILVFAHETGPVSRALLSRPLQRLGLYSYSIYLVHFPVLSILNSSIRVIQQISGIHLHDIIAVDGRTVDMISIGRSAFLNDLLALIFIAAVCGVSSLTYRYVEDPGRRFFNGLAERRRLGGASIAAA